MRLIIKERWFTTDNVDVEVDFDVETLEEFDVDVEDD